MTGFAVVLLALVNGEWVDIARFDTAHGCPHEDVLGRNGGLLQKVWHEPSATVRPTNWPSADFAPTMNSSDSTTSSAEADPIPPIKPDATIEELDDWVRALGGRELTPEESTKLRAEVRWSRVPGEKQSDPV